MLSFDEARERVLEAIPGPLDAEYPRIETLADLLDRILAEDIAAPLDLPPFDNSAVDGFAVRCTDTAGATPGDPVTLRVVATVRAGDSPLAPIRPHEAAAIFTGAPLPPGADGLVMVEDTERLDGDRVRIHVPGTPRHIRRAGSDIRRGAKALSCGDTLDPAGVGLLASLNVTRTRVYRRPQVWVQPTGDEVTPVGEEPLAEGRIRDSNGPALAAAVRKAGALAHVAPPLRDDEEEVYRWFTEWRDAPRADVLLVSGGVSMGDYDFVRKAAESVGSLNFWRVAIKPGKPLAFGRIGSTLFFGLPGNPVSSLVTFELFVRPTLRKLAGHRRLLRPTVTAVLDAPLPHRPGVRQFARATLYRESDTYRAVPLGAQDSHRLTSAASADALLIADENRGDYAAGTPMTAMLLDA